MEGKVVVVTGAGGVLCSAMAEALAERGARVALLGRGPSAERAAERVRARGGRARAYRCDVLERDALAAAREAVLADLGPCDVLINGAGGNRSSCTTAAETFRAPDGTDPAGLDFFSLREDAFDAVFDLNMKGAFLTCQTFMADMVGRRGCSVLNISSMNAFRPLTRIPAYSAAKAALSNFTAWLAVHFAPEGIRVNAIAPGFIETAQNRALLRDAGGALTERARKILRATPMGRFGEPRDLLGAVLWLTDERQSGFVTGVVLPIDGGFSAYSGV